MKEANIIDELWCNWYSKEANIACAIRNFMKFSQYTGSVKKKPDDVAEAG